MQTTVSVTIKGPKVDLKMKENEDMIDNAEVEMGRHYTLEYWLDEGWYVGRLKEIPGIFSQGETLNELKANILDAYLLMLEESKETLPENKKEGQENSGRALKRDAFLKELDKSGCMLKRHGKRHDLYINPRTGKNRSGASSQGDQGYALFTHKKAVGIGGKIAGPDNH